MRHQVWTNHFCVRVCRIFKMYAKITGCAKKIRSNAEASTWPSAMKFLLKCIVTLGILQFKFHHIGPSVSMLLKFCKLEYQCEFYCTPCYIIHVWEKMWSLIRPAYSMKNSQFCNHSFIHSFIHSLFHEHLFLRPDKRN